MEMLESFENDYTPRLRGYIEGEKNAAETYRRLATMTKGEMSERLRRMSADEQRHLKMLQMEHYLLTGDTWPGKKTGKTRLGLLDSLREAYADEGKAATAYSAEAAWAEDADTARMFREMSRDETRHRAWVRKMLIRLTGMS